jgi:hypothetical protein
MAIPAVRLVKEFRAFVRKLLDRVLRYAKCREVSADLAPLQREFDLLAAELLLNPRADRLGGGPSRGDALVPAALMEALTVEVGATFRGAINLVGREQVDRHMTEQLTGRVSPYLSSTEVAAEVSRAVVGAGVGVVEDPRSSSIEVAGLSWPHAFRRLG